MEHIVFIEASISGAGYQAIAYAKQLEVYVTLFTHNRIKYETEIEEGDLISLVDNIIQTETNDTDMVCQIILSLHMKHPVTAATTFADYFVPVAASAASVLGLPSISYKAALQCRNKYLMRLCFDKLCPELNPEYQLLDHNNILELEVSDKNPIVIKPIDENDSHNVFFTNFMHLANQHIDKLKATTESREGKKLCPAVLAERYVAGQEYSVEIYTYGSSCPVELIGITKKFFLVKNAVYLSKSGMFFRPMKIKKLL